MTTPSCSVSPFCDSHILALTALFNWSLRDEFGPSDALDLVAN